MDPDYFKHDRQEMLPFVPERRRRTLEIGCGEGRFSGGLPDVEERWGVEPSAAADLAKTRLTRVFHSTFEEAAADLPIGYFDVVICNDVIEHMPDHARFFVEIQKHIAPGGMLIGSIPNVRYFQNMFQYLAEKDWHYTDFGILDRTHMAFFTEKSLRKTLERASYDVIRMKGINAPTHFFGSGRDKIYLAAAYGLTALTLGYFRDILPLQFAFQAVPRNAASPSAV